MLKAKSPCSRTGCPSYQYKRSLCEHHYKLMIQQYEDTRGTSAQRGYTRHWRKLRDRFLQAYPRCFQCGYEATEVHHVKPLAMGGDSSWNNLEALCKSCHSRITRGAQNK